MDTDYIMNYIIFKKTAMSKSDKSPKKDSKKKESQDSKKKQAKTSSNKTLILIVVGLVLVVIFLLCAVGVLVLRNYTSTTFFERFRGNQEEIEVQDDESDDSGTDEGVDEDDETQEDSDSNGPEEDDSQEDEVNLQDFDGDFVTGEVPSDWQIIEYVDGDGTSMLATSISYEGLTALRVLNGTGDEVFYMGAVSGIGGTDACDEFYKFADTDPDYEDQIVDNSSDLFVTTTVIDLTGQDYTEFDLFGVRARRVGDELYKDSTESADTFDTSCGISHAFWWMDEVSFTVDGSESYSYQVYISGNPPEAELEVLDDILDSLEYSE